MPTCTEDSFQKPANRAVYSPGSLDEDVARMMLVDGVVLITLMLNSTRAKGNNLHGWLQYGIPVILLDVFLVENHILLFVLEEIRPNSSVLIEDFVKWTTKADQILNHDEPPLHLLEILRGA